MPQPTSTQKPMTKHNALHRLFSCFRGNATASTATATAFKKRLSTSLRDDLDDDQITNTTTRDRDRDQDQESPTSTPTSLSAPSRPSRSMAIGTFFGPRKGHVWFCIQHDRLSTKPSLLLELSIPTQQFVLEMRCGIVRIALECDNSELSSCPLRSVPIWTMSCNGRKTGFAARRKASHHNRLMLKAMQSTTVGAGVIPAGLGSLNAEEIMYMRANYEHVIGSADSESFHLVNPDECADQELSVFLMRSR